MKTLQIDEKKAKELYKTASQEFKITLEDTFGKDFFIGDITDKIKTVEDAYNVYSINRETIKYQLELKTHDNDIVEDLMLFNDLYFITKALNEGWEYKENDKVYSPYYSSAAGVFSLAVYSSASYVAALVGNLLIYKSQKLGSYSLNQFKPLWEKFLIKK